MLLHVDESNNLTGLYCRELFGAMEDIKVHRIFDRQYPQGYRVRKSISLQIRKVYNKPEFLNPGHITQ